MEWSRQFHHMCAYICSNSNAQTKKSAQSIFILNEIAQANLFAAWMGALIKCGPYVRSNL